jgi:hypothetical protein
MKAYALVEGDYMYMIVFDEHLAHEIASEYDFDIEVHDLEDEETIN